MFEVRKANQFNIFARLVIMKSSSFKNFQFIFFEMLTFYMTIYSHVGHEIFTALTPVNLFNIFKAPLWLHFSSRVNSSNIKLTNLNFLKMIFFLGFFDIFLLFYHLKFRFR
jgi:hypothetical protein